MAAETEDALIARARAGDRAAFGVLIDRYAEAVRRVARAVLHHPDDADDAADHRPDPVLGAALRSVLSTDDHATFVARVTGSLAKPHRVHWNVLASWAPRGIAVACVAAIGAGCTARSDHHGGR